jgi:acyl dehydratase
MTATRETLHEAGELVALKALLARADKTDLPREVAEVFAGQAYMLGLISTLLGMELPGQGTNYLKQETQWLGTVVPGQRVHTRVAITRLRPEKALVDLRTQVQSDSGEVLANGRALVSGRDVSGAF